MSQTPTMAAALGGILEDLLDDMHSCMPGIVVSYDASNETASVQPALKREYINERDERVVERHPVIQDVPIVFPGSGDYVIRFPITAGDTVTLHFASGSIDKWLAIGGEVDPEDTRRFSLSDAIAVPGLRSRANPRPVSASKTIEITATAINVGGTSALATKADLDALRNWVRDQFSSVNGHVHVVAGAATTTMTTVAVEGTPATPSLPPVAAGTLVTRGG